jgi:citrate synthase
MALLKTTAFRMLQPAKAVLPVCSRIQSRPASSDSTDLKEVVASQIPEHRKLVKEFVGKYGNEVVGQVTLDQMYGGMRDIKALVWETSVLQG